MGNRGGEIGAGEAHRFIGRANEARATNLSGWRWGSDV